MKTILSLILFTALLASADTNITVTVTLTDKQWAAVNILAAKARATPQQYISTNLTFRAAQVLEAQEQAEINDVTQRYRDSNETKRARILAESKR